MFLNGCLDTSVFGKFFTPRRTVKEGFKLYAPLSPSISNPIDRLFTSAISIAQPSDIPVRFCLEHEIVYFLLLVLSLSQGE
jgi:hypothetical protein